MKNAIQYYYGLYPEDIHQKNGSYEFYIGSDHYYLTPYTRSFEELEELYRITIQLFEKNIFCHQFVLNTSQKLVTVLNGIGFVLLKVFMESKEPVTIHDIIFFSQLIMKDTEKSLLSRSHWKELWIQKNDYLEYQVSQFGKSYPKIRESFSYFIGLSEIAIGLLNEPVNEENLVISHRRICRNDTIFDLYNPLNFVLDYKERDIIEFWKAELLDDSFSLEVFVEFLNSSIFAQVEWIRLLARAFYPTFCFDCYEKIIEYHQSEEILDVVIQKVPQYEAFLKVIYEQVKKRKPLPEIWLTKA